MALVTCAVAALIFGGAAAPSLPRAEAAQGGGGLNRIDHLIFIVQENRSFDHYFGTFPGADGIPRRPNGRLKVCIPNPHLGGCSRPYHATSLRSLGGPHNHAASNVDIARGRMNGFIRALPNQPNACWERPRQPGAGRTWAREASPTS